MTGFERKAEEFLYAKYGEKIPKISDFELITILAEFVQSQQEKTCEAANKMTTICSQGFEPNQKLIVPLLTCECGRLLLDNFIFCPSCGGRIVVKEVEK